jgi:hypothetical protein
MLKRFVPQALALAAIVVFSAAIALAQDAAPAPAPAPNPAQDAAPAPAQDPAATTAQRSDGQIEMDVVHALDSSSALKQDLITAATIQSEVTLSGTASSEASKELAENIVRQVTGVAGVHNKLKVGNPQAAQNAQPALTADPGPEQADTQPPDDGPATTPQGLPQQAPGQNQPYPPPYGQQRRQYAPPPPPAPAYDTPKGPVTVAAGTLLQLRTSEPVTTKHAKDGNPVQFAVIQDVAIGNVLAIPRGAIVHGVVTESKKAGALAGSADLELKLTSIDLGGQSYPLDSDTFKVKGPNKAGQTVGSALTGGVLGTIIGCAVGRGFGCAVGAGAGVAAGTAASAASPGPGIWIPAEARVDFHLNSPVTLNPVSAQEAARLAQGLYPGGPNLYRRGYYPYGQGYYGGYPYAYYPRVFYRPYFISGGYYYWR